jgi:glutathione synthase/RimK-type ligase-like ATP-grasp enzyme
MVTYLYSHNARSKGAQALASAMGIKRIKHENSRFKGGGGKTVINWGSTRILPWWLSTRIINPPQSVEDAVNKVFTFDAFKYHNISCPPWTTDKSVAMDWVGQGATVLARTVVNGSEGSGILVLRREDYEDPENGPLPDAPLYTQYIKKSKEFRVHVVDGKVIDIQQKVLRSDYPRDNVNWMVRNTANGFVFQRNGIVLPAGICDLAISAVASLQLDFGAVDIIYNGAQDKCFVLEVNTAPGLEGSTITKYKDALNEVCNAGRGS